MANQSPLHLLSLLSGTPFPVLQWSFKLWVHTKALMKFQLDINLIQSKIVYIHSYSNQLTAHILLVLYHNPRPSSLTHLVLVPLHFSNLKFILLKRGT